VTTEELRALVDAATPGPWEYTPFRYSDKEIAAGQMDADTRLIALAPALARLCAELGEALDRIWQRRESWYDAMHDDEAGLPSDEAEAAWEIASAALAKMAELEAR